MFGSVDIYLDEKEYNDLKKNGFDSSYGYHLWNVAVLVAPYDTGNLRSSIKLTSNSAKQLRFLMIWHKQTMRSSWKKD